MNKPIMLSMILFFIGCAPVVDEVDLNAHQEIISNSTGNYILTDTKITVVLSKFLTDCQVESVVEATKFYEEAWELEDRFVFMFISQEDIEELTKREYRDVLPTQFVFVRVNNDIPGIAHASWDNWDPTHIPNWNGFISVLENYCSPTAMAHEFSHTFNLGHVDDEPCNVIYKLDACNIEDVFITDEQVENTKKYAFGIPEPLESVE